MPWPRAVFLSGSETTLRGPAPRMLDNPTDELSR